jgi:hypothetical protein
VTRNSCRAHLVVTDHLADQAVVDAELEHAPDALDDVAQPDRPPALRHLLPECREVVGAEVFDEAALAEVPHQEGGSLLVLVPGPGGLLARFQKGLLVVEEGVGQRLDRQLLGVRPWGPAGVQGVLLRELLVEGAVGVVPRPEIMEFPAYFFAHTPAAWANRGKAGQGLAGLPAAAGAVESRSVMVTLPQPVGHSESERENGLS